MGSTDSPHDSAGRPSDNPISPDHLGKAELTTTGDFEAGSFASFVLTYTAGRYGIDDTGSLRIVFRFASDQSRPQFENPQAPGYTTISASGNVVLEYRYDPKGNTRPCDRTLQIKVVRGFLREGDTIKVHFEDTREGSPGARLQTFCEENFEFRVLVDPIATYRFQPLPAQPTISIVPGPAEQWRAVLPTVVRAGDPFRLCLKAEDKWGNPTDKADCMLRFESSVEISNLPETLRFEGGQVTAEIHDLAIAKPGDVHLRLLGGDGRVLAEANPLRVVPEADFSPYWGDLHGQSEETIGTNSARSYFTFARDRAFLDVAGHQGNDFQITKAFWAELGGLTAAFDEAGRFVTLPGYEWSGNTGLGGDRNVYFSSEGRAIRRSSHALVGETDDIDTDCTTAQALFDAFRGEDEDVVCFAHCGGRYADIKLAHDGHIERSVEIHSSWGTFEWLLRDAFEMGYRVGIVANSDGHKGRPGASYPGASLFGAIGGLTCLLMPELTREAVFECLRGRRHYATTGARMVLDVVARFEGPATLYHDDPALGPAQGRAADVAMMGGIVHLPEGEAVLKVDVLGSVPLERLDIFNGLDHVETVRPFDRDALGNRIRVVWEGAEYRGRFRQVIWDGTATVSDNRILEARGINFFNREKTLDRLGENSLKWRALTTGNFGGFDVWLADPYGGTLQLETPLVKCGVPIEDIGLEDQRIDAGGLDRSVRVFRLPSENPHRSLALERKIALKVTGDNPIYVRVTQEDGHVAWSSPIYIYR